MVGPLFIVLASVVVPAGVAWFTSRSGEPFRSWSQHPWVFFWCAPFVPIVVFLPIAVIWREQIPSLVMMPIVVLWSLSAVVIVLSAVHGLRLTYRRSRWRFTLVMTFFVAEGAFGILLSGDPPAFLTAPVRDARSAFMWVLSGVVFATWLALMAVASGFASAWLTARR